MPTRCCFTPGRWPVEPWLPVLEVELPLPEQVCQRTLTRVFPWVSLELGTPEVLLLAVTGRATVHGIPSDPEWWWQSAPLTE